MAPAVSKHDPSGYRFPNLNDTSRATIYNLLGFLVSRQKVDEVATQKLPARYMDGFPSFTAGELRQKRLGGSGAVSNYAELAELGSAAMQVIRQPASNPPR